MSKEWFENSLSLANEEEGELPELEVFEYILRGQTRKSYVCEKDIPSALQKLWNNLDIKPTDIESMKPVDWEKQGGQG
jgi:hypothetical protein